MLLLSAQYMTFTIEHISVKSYPNGKDKKQCLILQTNVKELLWHSI